MGWGAALGAVGREPKARMGNRRPSSRSGEPGPALLAITQGEPTASAVAASAATLNAAAIGPGASLTLPPPANGASATGREIQASTRVLEPNYTIEAGDTLGRIAARFNTTVERIQAFNNLPDPRALRIGAKLVIPPPL